MNRLTFHACTPSLCFRGVCAISSLECAKRKKTGYKVIISVYNTLVTRCCLTTLPRRQRLSFSLARKRYTRRIMELVRNISKQKEDIDKVLIDTRAVQKDIAQLGEKSARIYAETEDMIFKNAKKDEVRR
jgi:hypothetical protein